jgi:hypothetical protein
MENFPQPAVALAFAFALRRHPERSEGPLYFEFVVAPASKPTF